MKSKLAFPTSSRAPLFELFSKLIIKVQVSFTCLTWPLPRPEGGILAGKLAHTHSKRSHIPNRWHSNHVHHILSASDLYHSSSSSSLVLLLDYLEPISISTHLSRVSEWVYIDGAWTMLAHSTDIRSWVICSYGQYEWPNVDDLTWSSWLHYITILIILMPFHDSVSRGNFRVK